MIYILATIGTITVLVVLWRAFGPEGRPEPPARGLAPDDDPEFLRKLDEQHRNRGGNGGDGSVER